VQLRVAECSHKCLVVNCGQAERRAVVAAPNFVVPGCNSKKPAAARFGTGMPWPQLLRLLGEPVVCEGHDLPDLARQVEN